MPMPPYSPYPPFPGYTPFVPSYWNWGEIMEKQRFQQYFEERDKIKGDLLYTI